MEKAYIGDGVYAEVNDNGDLILTTENGLEVTNQIIIEAEVLITLLLYIKKSPIAQLLN